MSKIKLMSRVYHMETLTIEHIHYDEELFWTVTDNNSNILYKHIDRDCAIQFAHQHNKMLKAEQKYKELQNA